MKKTNKKLGKNISVTLKGCEKTGPLGQEGFIHTIGIRKRSSM